MASTGVAHAAAEDELVFTELVRRHRHELRVHTYRMLGSREESEDLTQQTFLSAWDKRHSFRGDASLRSWLYRIATNACLNRLELRARRGEVVGLAQASPDSDRPLADFAAQQGTPEVEIESKETVELALLTAIRHLPRRQRTVLFLRDVLGWPAKESAELMGTSVASSNSALQRARASLRKHLPADRLEWEREVEPSAAERMLLQRYLSAAEHADLRAVAGALEEPGATPS
jgi:RNA polymerase sigma-70 factor (ECF subfamily)